MSNSYKNDNQSGIDVALYLSSVNSKYAQHISFISFMKCTYIGENKHEFTAFLSIIKNSCDLVTFCSTL